MEGFGEDKSQNSTSSKLGAFAEPCPFPLVLEMLPDPSSTTSPSSFRCFSPACPSSPPGSGLVLSLNPSGDQMPLRISKSTRLQPQLHPDMCSKPPALYCHCHKLYSFTFQSMSLNSSSWEEGRAYGKACSLAVLKTQHQCWHSGVCTVSSCPDYCKSWSIWSSSHCPKLHQSKP